MNVQQDGRPIDAITLYAMMREMNDNLMAQARATNNSVSSIQRTVLGLQTSIATLIESLTETRDKRYQEEIDVLQSKLEGISREINSKQAAKVDNRTTAEKILSAAKEAVTDIKEEETRRTRFDWIDARNKVVVALLISLTIALVYYVAPYIGVFIQNVFVR